MSIVIDEIDINNVVLFKKAKIPLSKYPLVVVRGENLDSRSKDTANRCGKTLGFSLIPTVLFGSPPTSVKKKDAGTVHDKDSSIHLRWQNNGKKYEGIQFAKGKSVGYDLQVNGKAKNFRKGVDAQLAIAKALPINEKQFYSFVYLNSLLTHPLHMGSTTERFDFFEKVFNLDIYDKIAKEISKEYASLKFAAQKLKELEAERALRSAELPKAKLSVLRDKRETLMSKAEKVRTKVDQYLKELRDITAYMTLAEDLPLDAVFIKERIANLAEMRQDEEHLRANLKKSIEFYATYDKETERQNRRQTIESKIANLRDKKSKFSADELQAKLATIQDDVTKLTFAIRDHNKLKAKKYETWQAVLYTGTTKQERKLWSSKFDLNKVRNGLIKERQKVDAWIKSTDSLQEHEGSVCPSCNKPLSLKERQSIIKINDESVEESRKKSKQWRRVEAFLEAYAQYKAVDYDAEQHDADTTKHSELTNKYNILKTKLTNTRELESLQRELKSIPHVELSKAKTTKPETYEDALTDLRKRIKVAENCVERVRKIKTLGLAYTSYAEAKERYEQLQAYIDKYQPILEKAQNALHRMTVEVTKSEALASELNRLSKQIDKQRDASADFKVYEALRQAYGAKGLRKLRVASIAVAFESNLNLYAPKIFEEKITFRIDITSTRFDIYAKRNNKRESDVRSLSGQEGRAYNLLILLALLPFIPAHARCNLVVLDEMESGLDKPARRLMATEFLPLLNTLVPNIVVVTPLSTKDWDIPNAVTYLVQKKNNYSKIFVNDNVKTYQAA